MVTVITEYQTLKQQQEFKTKAVMLLEDNFSKEYTRKECEYFFNEKEIDYLSKYGRKELDKLNRIIENIEDIYTKVDNGATLTEIAEEKNVSKQAISKQFNRIYPKGYIHFEDEKKLAKIREHREMNLYFSLEEYATYFNMDISSLRKFSKKYDLGLLTTYNLMQKEKVDYYTPIILQMLANKKTKVEIRTELNITRKLLDKILTINNISVERKSSSEIEIRNENIVKDSNELTVKELSAKYELTPKYINEILRKQPVM